MTALAASLVCSAALLLSACTAPSARPQAVAAARATIDSVPADRTKLVPLGSTVAQMAGWLESYDELVFEPGTYRFLRRDVLSIPSGRTLRAQRPGETTFAGRGHIRIEGEVRRALTLREVGPAWVEIDAAGVRPGDDVVLREAAGLHNGQNDRKGRPQQLLTVTAAEPVRGGRQHLRLDRAVAFDYAAIGPAGERPDAFLVDPVERVSLTGIRVAGRVRLDLALARETVLRFPLVSGRAAVLRMAREVPVASDRVTIEGVWSYADGEGPSAVNVRLLGLSRSRLDIATRGGRKDGIEIEGASDLRGGTLEADAPSHRGVHIWQSTGALDRVTSIASGSGLQGRANIEGVLLDHVSDLTVGRAEALDVQVGDGVEVRGPVRRVRIGAVVATEDAGQGRGVSGLNLHAWGGEDIEVADLSVTGFLKPLRIADGGSDFRILGGRIDKGSRNRGEAIVIGETLQSDLRGVLIENVTVRMHGPGVAVNARDHNGTGHRLVDLVLRNVAVEGPASRRPFARIDNASGVTLDRVVRVGAAGEAPLVGRDVRDVIDR